MSAKDRPLSIISLWDRLNIFENSVKPTFCEKLPKIELHAHLNGSLSNETLKTLGCLDKSIEEYHKLTEVIDKSERTLQECFQLFAVAHQATNKPESVYKATESVIQDFFKENVIYLELRTTPRNEQDMSKEEYVESVVKAIKDNEKDILVKLILSIDRKNDSKTNWENVDFIIKMKEKYPDIIKGIDLSGNPAVGAFDEKLFEKAKLAGLHTTIHCAEIKNDNEVESILKFSPDRIGHGTYLHPNYNGSQALWNLYCDKRIPLECCLTSNVVCGTSKSYAEHHILEWIQNGLPFSISTDDKGVFCTSLSEEYKYFQEHFKLTPTELWNVSNNAIDFCFASEEEKSELKKKMINWLLFV